MVRRKPGGLPDGSLVLLRRMVRDASAKGLDRGGPAYCPTACLALQWMVRDRLGVLPDGSLTALPRVIRSDGSLDNCLTGKIR